MCHGQESDSIWARTSPGLCWKSNPQFETNRAMSFFKSAIDHAVETAWIYKCDKQICPCLQIVTCEIEDRQVYTMGVNDVTMRGKIRQDGLCSQDTFAQVPLCVRKCPHDIDVNVEVKVTMNQWTHVVSKGTRFIAVQAVLKDGLLDTTGFTSGVLMSPSDRHDNPDQSSYVTCELFSGGFSGWSHVFRRLTAMQYNMLHRIAVDIDEVASEAFCRSHGFQHWVGPHDMTWDQDELPDRMFVIGDITDHRWLHLFSDEQFDIAVMSPPCPPWSKATSCPGLDRHEGRLTLHGWGLMNLLRPKTVCMEMVGSMKTHEHWPIIRMMIQWAGYSIRYATVLGLSEFTPQHRDRLLIVATLDCQDFHPHRCVPWPTTQRHTLESFLNIMQLEEPWKTQSTIDPITLKMYLDPEFLPKNRNERQPLKKSKTDMEMYRIRHTDGIFGCIMANYGYAHLLPDQSLRTFGLYGTILAEASGLRFLSIPEIAIAHGALAPFWLPADFRSASRLLGNAITTPHALVAVTNAMAFLAGYTGVEIQQIMMEAMTGRYTSQNLVWERKWGGFSFTIDEDVCKPTMLMHESQKVTIVSPTERFVIQAERDVIIWDAIHVLTGPSKPKELSLMPGGDLDSRVSLPKSFTVKGQKISIFSPVPCVLGVSTKSFAVGSHNSTCIVVLTSEGIFVLKRDQGLTVQDVQTVLNHHFDLRCTHLVGILGERLHPQTLCPDAVIARDRDSASNDLQVLDFVQVSVDEGYIQFSSSHEALTTFTEFLQDTGLLEMLPALGWILTTDIEAFIQKRAERITLVRKPAALALLPEELAYFLAIFLFITKIKSWDNLGETPNIRAKIKLWHTCIWDATVSKEMTLAKFEEEWKGICRLFQLDKPWRFVTGGRCINPLWPIESFVEDGNITIHMLLGLKGGGPKSNVNPRTNEQMANSDNLRNMAEFEATKFTSALSFILRKVVDFRGTISRCDISNFLGLQAKASDGYYVIKGDFPTVRQFLHTIRETGIEEALHFCGWMVTCRFINIYEPIQADIIIFRKPLSTAVTPEFVRALIRSALVRIGMPPPVRPSERSVLTKIKLWNTVIFEDFLDRNFPLQDLVDTWEQASTIVCDQVAIRLVGPSGNMNPDFPLRHFTKCDDKEQTVATINFVVGLRGGGYVERRPANSQEYNIQQRNALATFLMSQGADIHDCVKFIDGVIGGAGPAAVSSILGQKQVAKRWDGLIQLATALNIQTPDVMTRLSKARTKIQNKILGKNKQSPSNLEIDALALQPGFLVNEDGTHACQINKLTPNTTGVILMEEMEALQWLQKHATISQDELAICVVGGDGISAEYDGLRVQLPVSYKNDPLIIQATLFNVGAKKITMSTDDNEDIPGSETQVVSITAYADEIGTDAWSAILQSPVKHIMKTLLPDDPDFSFLATPWGRSFQCNCKRCEPKQATSVQFHARLHKADLRTIMRASGVAGVYTTPKSEDRQIVTDYQVIWLQQTKVEMMVSISRVENHLGLVRGQKSDGKGRGIRFHRQDFAAAFALLKPDLPLPSLVQNNHMFKVAPTPVGTTADQVRTWIEQQGWEAKPIRALSSTTWLCAAEQKFDGTFLQWNGAPVLIQWISQRKDRQPLILAGQIPKLFPKATSSHGEPAQNSTDLLEDPWKNYIAKQGGTGMVNQNQNAKVNSATPVVMQPPRKLESPIEDKFNRYESSLQELRDKGEKEMAGLKGDIIRLQQAMTEQQQQTQYNMEMTNAEFRAIRAETHSQFQNMSTMFQDSLQKAIGSHDTQMHAQFEELKELMLNKAPRSSPAQKKHKGPENKNGPPNQPDDAL